jgi:hypothetical protein
MSRNLTLFCLLLSALLLFSYGYDLLSVLYPEHRLLGKDVFDELATEAK